MCLVHTVYRLFTRQQLPIMTAVPVSNRTRSDPPPEVSLNSPYALVSGNVQFNTAISQLSDLKALVQITINTLQQEKRDVKSKELWKFNRGLAQQVSDDVKKIKDLVKKLHADCTRLVVKENDVGTIQEPSNIPKDMTSKWSQDNDHTVSAKPKDMYGREVKAIVPTYDIPEDDDNNSSDGMEAVKAKENIVVVPNNKRKKEIETVGPSPKKLNKSVNPMQDFLDQQLKTLKYACHRCSESFTDIEKLRDHLLMYHSAGRTKTYVCNFCEKRFVTKEILADHKVTHAKRAYLCKFCGVFYEHYSVLTYHCRDKHSNQLSEMCNICDLKFLSKADVSDHIDNSHIKIKPKTEIKPPCQNVDINNCVLLCSKCLQVCNNMIAMTKHHRTCHPKDNDPPYVVKKTETFKYYSCNDCSSMFVTDCHLQKHRQDSHSRTCRFCDKVFFNKMELSIHLKGHKAQEFSCSFCKKIHSAMSSLEGHCRDQHYEQMPFHCIDCKMGFLRKDTLKRHLKMSKTCQDEPVLECITTSVESDDTQDCLCEFCDQIFPNYQTLLKHLQNCSKEESIIDEESEKDEDKTDYDLLDDENGEPVIVMVIQ